MTKECRSTNDKRRPLFVIRASAFFRHSSFVIRPSSLSWQSSSPLMATSKRLLAFDLGAESGRGVLGLFDGSRLHLEVVHRFPNGPVRTLDTMHWDVLRLWGEMLAGLRKCAAQNGGVDSVGVDAWGVDF